MACLKTLCEQTGQLRVQILERLAGEPQDGRLRQLQDRLGEATGRCFTDVDFSEHYAQAVACAWAAAQGGQVAPRVACTVTGAASGWLRAVLEDGQAWQQATAARLVSPAALGTEDDLVRRSGAGQTERDHETSLGHLYEEFLACYSTGQRRRHGVFYTPPSLARFTVRKVHQLLREEFALTDGLADTTTWGQLAHRHADFQIPRGVDPDQPFVQVLDPAVGSGAFLVAVIEVVHTCLVKRWRAEGRSAEERKELWNAYVPRHLLPRLFGLELLLPPLMVAHLRILARLTATGYEGQGKTPLGLYLADTLADPRALFDDPQARGAQRAAALTVRCRTPVTVVVGNPPFSGISDHQGSWIHRLLHGKQPDGRSVASYYEVDGSWLGERKHWLQDDYVKFFRYAQWCIERSGYGILGLVTNHGYLDNTTFRGMRQQLLKSFPRINVLDLHGNCKKREASPDGRRDENVFAIEQGVAVGLLRRPPLRLEPRALHGEMWGERSSKLAALDRSAVQWRTVRPQSPHYFLVPRDDRVLDEYRRGFPLNEIMPVNSTAVVTARDRFVIAFEQPELRARMSQFRDLSIPDQEIRKRYFTNGRSRKYPAGDTRGWKLSEARRRMARDPHWDRHIRRCLYRPFDQRSIYWADWMIDWPRGEVTRHLLAGRNVSLIARRQMLPTQPCNYFWVANLIAIDGVIRSDNRGSESVFPLYVQHPNGTRRANLDSAFVKQASHALSLEWTGDGPGDLAASFGPEDLLHYFYALFHSPTYRTRYAAGLQIDFPRVFLTAKRDLFRELCQLGSRLVALHRLLDAAALPQSGGSDPPHCAADNDGDFLPAPPLRFMRRGGSGRGRSLHEAEREVIVESGFPRYHRGSIELSAEARLENVDPAVWKFQAGGYQVCRKWLRDRQGRVLGREELELYQRIVAAIAGTLRLMPQIDRRIEAYGGWSSVGSDSARRGE